MNALIVGACALVAVVFGILLFRLSIRAIAAIVHRLTWRGTVDLPEQSVEQGRGQG